MARGGCVVWLKKGGREGGSKKHIFASSFIVLDRSDLLVQANPRGDS